MPKVTVLVPVYNVEKYLRQCMESIVNQTLKDIEIICINDGSTDASLEILKEYGSRDSRITIVDKQNTGYGNSMNIGLEMANGEYIGIIESDDFAELDMFDTLYSLAKEDNLDVARSEFYYYDNNTGRDTKSNSDYVPHNKVIRPSDELSVFYQQPSIWANIYRKSFIKNNKIKFLETPGASYQDTSFTFKVYSLADRYEMINQAFLHYRTFAGSSSFVGNTKVFCVCDEYDEIEKFLKDNGLFEKQCDLYYHLKFNAYRWNYFRLDDPYDKEFSLKWSSDFKEAYNQGLLKLDKYAIEEISEIKELMYNGSISKNSPLLSIIVPIYNSEKYIRKCLDSLINQTIKNIEIICVNDGSTDSSRSIISEYEKKDSRIRVIDKQNGGLSSARNAGLDVARSRYVCFLDSDDWVLPEAYESALIKMDDCDIVVFGTEVVYDYLQDKRQSDAEYYRIKYSGKLKLTDEIRLNTDVSAWNKIYRMDLINANNIRFPEGKLYEDYNFYWQYIVISEVAYYDQHKYHRYLRHEGSIMADTFLGSSCAIEHLDVLKMLFKKWSAEDNFIEHSIRNNSMFLNCFWFAYLNVKSKDKRKVMRYGYRLVNEFNLFGDPIIDSLRKKEYYLVDSRKNYTFTVRILKKLINLFEKATGSDLKPLTNIIYNEPITDDCCDSIATTGWVIHHFESANSKNSVVYDCSSDDESLNWSMSEGLRGGCSYTHQRVKEIFKEGTRFTILVTIWGAEVAFLDGIVISSVLTIVGTSFFDGINLFNISVRIEPDLEKLEILAIDQNGKRFDDFASIRQIIVIM